MNAILVWLAANHWAAWIIGAAVPLVCLAIPNTFLKPAGVTLGLFLIKAFGKGAEQKIIDVLEGFQSGLESAQTTIHEKTIETTAAGKTTTTVDATVNTTAPVEKFADNNIVG